MGLDKEQPLTLDLMPWLWLKEKKGLASIRVKQEANAPYLDE